MESCSYYFAYGSNMNRERMAEREVKYSNANLAFVRGYSISFNKVASGIDGGGYANLTLTGNLNDIVYGLVYELASASELEKLDVFEGVSAGHYERKTLSLTLAHAQAKKSHSDSNKKPQEHFAFSRNGSLDAIAYLACSKRIRSNLRPTKEYLSLLLSATELPEDYRAKLTQTDTVD